MSDKFLQLYEKKYSIMTIYMYKHVVKKITTEKKWKHQGVDALAASPKHAKYKSELHVLS